MKYASLTETQKLDYLAAVVNSHKMRVIYTMYDHNESNPVDISPYVIDGQIDADNSAEIAYSLSITLVDAKGRLNILPNSAFEASVYPGNFIGVEHCIYVDALSSWVEVPVFFGPISALAVSNDITSLAAQSKEALLYSPIKGKDITAPATKLTYRLIQDVLEEYGETKFRLDTGLSAKVGKNFEIKVGQDTNMWNALRKVAADDNYILYYDTEGYACMRLEKKTTTGYRFHDGDSGSIIGLPSVSYNLENTKNQVQVFDKDHPASGKPYVSLTLPPEHPFSPKNLGRNGVNRFMVSRYTFHKSVSRNKAKRKAEVLLGERSQAMLEIAFESIPIPTLSLNDICQLDYEGTSLSFTLNKFTLPLTPSGTMSIGFNKAVKLEA